MSGPWMKFYPSDWRADPALRMCSIAARGLWMELICLMHEAGGSLRVNGKPLTVRQVASLAGISVDEAAALMEELSDAGVFSRDEDGTIYSRRIRRDIERAEQDKANGRKGGNPTVKGGVNPGVKGEVKAQKPEARTQKPEPEADPDPDDEGDERAGRTPIIFEAGCIRLNEADFQKWKEAFPNINLQAELLALADWAARQPKWFNAVAGALAKKDRETRLKLEKVRAEAARDPPDQSNKKRMREWV